MIKKCCRCNGVQCIKNVVCWHLITNILIQSKGIEMNDICPRNRAFFHSQDFHHLLRLKNCLKTFSH